MSNNSYVKSGLKRAVDAIVKDAGPKFRIGQKVWYRDRIRGRLPAIIEGIGDKDDRLVYDVTIEGEKDQFERDKWGYEDQLSPR